MKKFEILEHPADLKIRIYGRDLIELFINAGLALASQQNNNKTFAAGQSEWEKIELESADLNSLLVDWLNELIWRGEAEKKIYFDFKIKEISEACLKAEIKGAPLKQKQVEIKAATYHGLEIIQQDSQWQATVIFDI